MNEYMICFYLPENPDEEFFDRIPSQRAMINQLMDKQIISSYALSEDRTKLWATLSATDEDEVESILRKFPLYHYMDYDITELAFNNLISVSLPTMSLN